MAKYRLGVRDEEVSSAVLWTDYDNSADAYYAWRLLRDYGRDGVRAGIQERNADGDWITVHGASFPNVAAQ